MKMRSRAAQISGFWGNVKKSRGCWEWTAHVHWTGYGRAWYMGRKEQAHRLAWNLEVGPIPKGLLMLHKCDNRKCVRPSHLFPGTYKENTQDMIRKGRDNRKPMPGELHPNAKLTDRDAVRILELRGTGLTRTEIGTMFGVSIGPINSIFDGRGWKHIPR